MLTLAAAETLRAVAGAATALTYTVFGMELLAGVESYKTLAQGQLPSSVGTLYTAPASTQVFVKSIHFANATSSDVTGIKLYKNGTAAANQITGSLTVPANGWAVYNDDGWAVFNASGERLMNGVTSSGGGGGAAAISRLTYTFDNASTADSDPGAGKFRYSTSTMYPTADLVMYISTTDANAIDQTSALDALLVSDSQNTTLVRIFSSLSTDLQSTFKLTSKTSGTGYRKYGLKAMNIRDIYPGAISHSIQFEVLGANALTQSSFSDVSNASQLTGLPGFTPNKTKSKTLTSVRAQGVVFAVQNRIFVRQFCTLITTNASTGGDARFLIYNVHDVRGDGLIAGALVYDSGLQAGFFSAGTGLRAHTPSPQFFLPPGLYLMITAINTFTGSLVATALNGSFRDSALINVASSQYEVLTDFYLGSNLTGTPSDPLGAITSWSQTLTALGTTAGHDQFDLVTSLRFTPST